MPYRVGIIGCGPRAAKHAEALRQMPEVEIVGAADIAPERLTRFGAEWEIENLYASSAALLDAQRLDLVTIATLPPPHRALVTECAAAGVPVINCEKVVAYHLADLDAMLAASEAAGSLLTVNHQMRFMPQFLAVRDLVASGRLGEVTFLRGNSRGSLTEQGTHVMDQMLFMNGDVPVEWVLGAADGAAGYERTHPAPSSTSASLRFANGACGSIVSGLLGAEVDPEGGFWLQKFVEVTGTRGWAGAYVNSGWRAVLDTGEVLSGPGTWEPNWPAQAELFRAGLRWIEDRSLLHPTRGELARLGLEALFGLCRSALEHRAVTLPLERAGDALFDLRPHLS